MTKKDPNIEAWTAILREDRELLEEMARIGFFKDGGIRFEVIVFTDDAGYKPHFHIRDANTKGAEFHTCIEILHPRYFHHAGKEDTLNTKAKKKLIEYLKAPSNAFDDLTNWDVLLRLWNSNNSKKKVKKDLEIPDYMML